MSRSIHYHAVRPKYAQRYLAEFVDRFNRRFGLPDIIPDCSTWC